MSLNILITEEGKYPEDALNKLRDLGTVTEKIYTQAEFEEVVPDVDVLIVGLGLHINKDVIDKGSKLKLIATATTGMDHIDVAYAKEKNIPVISLKGEGEEFLKCVTATSELALALMLAIVRHIVPAANAVENYEWKREQYQGNEMEGKTLGLLGLGRLGKHMARYGNALQMKVIACDPYIADEEFTHAQVQKVSSDELYAQADVLSLHVVLNDETKNLVTQAELQQMKSSAIVVNTSRGQIVNEADMLKALQNKTIAGYATDVLANEVQYHENFTTDPLVEYAKENRNCLIVPHLGGMAYEAAYKTRRFITDKVIQTLESLS